MLTGNFHPHKIYQDSHLYLKYKKYEFLLLKKAYRAVWNDLRFFPVADSAVFFEDSWMESRSYGGSRHHEGTDLFGQNTISGYYPIISMTDGVVEQKGWLPLGGYRIGIRADSGGYFYYAHLASYEKEFSPGDTVHAGDILGFMGNTGYGKEGTSGKFPVHLHLGIYISVPGTEELSINPYHILLAVRKNIRKYTYY
ncbi:M23 family metallopeptidase [Blautia sp. MSJ-19]|nr:M23 family metallopeptidase [Blautia sp. MSJ-19]